MSVTIHREERKCTRVPLAGKPLSYWKDLAERDAPTKKEPPKKQVYLSITGKKDELARNLSAREGSAILFKGYLDCIKDADSPDLEVLLSVGLDSRSYEIKWMALEKAEESGFQIDWRDYAFKRFEAFHMNNYPSGEKEKYFLLIFFFKLIELCPGILEESEERLRADKLNHFFGPPIVHFLCDFAGSIKVVATSLLEPGQILNAIELGLTKIPDYMDRYIQTIADVLAFLIGGRTTTIEEKKKALWLAGLLGQDEYHKTVGLAIRLGAFEHKEIRVELVKIMLGCQEELLNHSEWKMAAKIWRKSIIENPENALLNERFPAHLRPKLIMKALKSKDSSIRMSAVMQAQNLRQYLGRSALLSFFIKRLLSQADKTIEDLGRKGFIKKTLEEEIIASDNTLKNHKFITTLR